MQLYPKNGRHEMIVFQLSVNRPIINIKPISKSNPIIPMIVYKKYVRLCNKAENNINCEQKGMIMKGCKRSEG